MKKVLISSLALIIAVIVLFKSEIFRNSQSDCLQFLNKIFIGDVMKVNNSPNIDKNKIKICISNKTIYENNIFLDNIGEVYGGPIFDIYYDNKLIGLAFHDNKNDWYTNKYTFTFFKTDKQVRYTFKTNGHNGNGEEGYKWITQYSNYTEYESYSPDGYLINKWK